MNTAEAYVYTLDTLIERLVSMKQSLPGTTKVFSPTPVGIRVNEGVFPDFVEVARTKNPHPFARDEIYYEASEASPAAHREVAIVLR